MDLVDQMTTFVRVVEAGSLSAAARRLSRSLAAVSRQLGALERELGAPLLVRSTRRMQITPAGQRWYQHCVRMLRELEEARLDVADTRKPAGRVVVSAPFTLGLWWVVPRLEQLARTHPGLDLDLRLEDQVVDLVGEGVDVAVRAGVALPDSTSIVATRVTEFRRVAVAAPSYLARRGTPKHPRELARHDGLVQTHSFATWRFERGDESVEATPRVRMRCQAPQALREWALAGAGIALLPEWLVAGTRGLQRLFEPWTTAPIRVWMLQRIELRGSARVRAVIDALAS